jgi:peptidoglycan/xylan/chitin deacetylase (PgdA/CDA1 family)
VSLDLVVGALRSGDWDALPPRPLVITIDDGHARNLQLTDAFRRHGVRPALFICTQIVGTLRHFWFLDGGPEAVESLKALPEAQRLAELERRDFSQQRDYGPAHRQALSAGELEAMRPHWDVESHGRFHPVLTRVADQQARDEIEASRTEVEELAGGPCAHFSYPLGAYGPREVELARQAGYSSARTVDIGWNGPRTDPYRLKILSVADDLSATMLAAELTGLKWLIRLLKREGRLNGTFRPKWDPENAR